MKYVLAPLAEFTNAAFRKIAHEMGADLTYTEMASAAALAHGSSPTRHLFETLPDEGPVVCQIFGHNVDEVACAARAASACRAITSAPRGAAETSDKASAPRGAAETEKETSAPRFVALDLNAGCPMPRIRHEGDGAALVENPQLVHDLLVAMKRETDLPVTLKTRPGPHPERVNMFELLDAAETAGAAGITLHARFTSQMHGGAVHLDLLAELVQRAKIPVTGNGGVHDAATAAAMAATGVDAIMLGRAAISHPDIFRRLKGDDAPPLRELFERHVRYLLELRERLAQKFPNDHVPSPDGFVSVALHKHLFHYFKGIPGAAELRRRLNEIRTLAETQALASLLP